MAEFLKIPELARRLEVSEKTARRYVKAGAIPSTFIGGAYRVSEADLETYLEDARVAGGGSGKAQFPLPFESPDNGDGGGDARQALIDLGDSLLRGWSKSLHEFIESNGTDTSSPKVYEVAQLVQFSWDVLCTYTSYEKAVMQSSFAEDRRITEILYRMDAVWSTAGRDLVKPLVDKAKTEKTFRAIAEAHPELMKSIESI